MARAAESKSSSGEETLRGLVLKHVGIRVGHVHVYPVVRRERFGASGAHISYVFPIQWEPRSYSKFPNHLYNRYGWMICALPVIIVLLVEHGMWNPKNIGIEGAS